MPVTKAQLSTLYPRAIPDLLSGVAAAAGDVLGRFGIADKPDRLAYFLAQVGHESGGLTINAENLNYSAKRMTEVWPRRFPTIAAAAPFANNPEKLANFVYGGRMGNGPPASGDGFRFRGRGLIQITGRDGYREVGARAGLPMEADPDLVTVPGNALLCAAAFWKWKGLNPVCDARDFTRCTIIINGGTTGIADRREWLDKVRRVLAAPPPAPAAQPPAELVIRVQKALLRAGFAGVGAADGDAGPRTLAAITAFRQSRGLAAGGIDAPLLKALGITP
ncbi:peptidoglycan-binding protein [Polymorphobacter fuscus]|uniref:Glycoside hydrolase family 19 protein n=1 Tax=Sandarakinorhabdus fusca TaxID=1439888 RepID=A0A7C9LF97_9SPHN|nr:peptidoglycan-binding protein [Polymorphobacter fuscus]KAB7648955.1 glycoside hydrolase family 19 protein [Polymorphobacter fuscus]MQT16547.1 glycoside hydrolase family 19 protein [Polymorphobacter fuscus]NJC07162.1 putative chitinase [Polymorphobacter fuscus]